ncbi:MAG TPA: DNA polymerase/3'-5' exonuclease PolX [bacterium]|nr:DNA polymerase/3'-5' exonuclease PolX [bacterium]
MKNKDIARLFNKMADILEFKGDMPFRINAYRHAARVVEDMTEDIAAVAAAGRLTELEGIGDALAKKIGEYLATGHMSKYDEIRAGVPDGVIELLGVPGMGPKTVALVHRDLGVKNIDELEGAVAAGRVRALPGMGEKKEENILRGIRLYRSAHGRISIGAALPLVDRIVAVLKKDPRITRIDPAGSLRRMQETIGDIDILACGEDGKGIIDAFTRMPGVREILACGETKGSVIADEGLQVDLRVVGPECYGAALQHFTGSKEHNVELRELAKGKGFKISEYGIFKGERRVGGREEGDIYKKLGLDLIPPPLRQGRGEIEAALHGKLPDPVTIADVKGDLHVHSTWSDGASSVEEIAAEAQRLGYAFVAVCDHSQSLKVARGLSIEAVYRKMEEVAKVRKLFPKIEILCGAEVDIRGDGTIDYPDDLLKELDVVIAAIHSGFKESGEQITSRILNAVANPHVDIIAHPTGRIISSREPYAVDLERVFAAAAKTGTLMEINSYYDRLDLCDTACRRAKEHGVKFSLGTDAHHCGQMWMMRLGVGVAQRGWLEKGDIANCWPKAKLLSYLRKRPG